MSSANEVFDTRLAQLIEEASSYDLKSEESTAAMMNLKKFSECRPPEPEPTPEPTVVPTTRWGKVRTELAAALDNETTRAIIKAGGAFAGVGLVVYSTIHRDHVMERTALQQANQRPA